ncbi:unnamed protein product [Alopecurus aequalis]
MKLTCMQLLTVAFLATLVTMSSAALQYNFYSSSCPSAEETIKSKVNYLINGNPSVAAALIRLLFHDCFVTGCDGSILLDGSSSEKSAIPLAVAGYNAVDAIKAAVESECPGTVSCADILAFAARDAVNRSAGYYYAVNSGRRDLNSSTSISILTNMPTPRFSIQDLVARFAQKNLNIVDLVALSGAHAIGVAHCSSVSNRLYPSVDPTMDPAYAADLKQRCPSSGVPDNLLNNSAVSPTVLDNQYFKNVVARRVLFTSDAALLNRNDTAAKVAEMAADPAKWIAQFAASMVKMGSINVTTGTQGQVRTSCRKINSPVN